jgi:hypothetical protein
MVYTEDSMERSFFNLFLGKKELSCLKFSFVDYLLLFPAELLTAGAGHSVKQTSSWVTSGNPRTAISRRVW